MRTALRSIGAAVAGYALIVVITSFGFPLVLGHALVDKGDLREVVLGTIVAVIAGFAGGYVGTMIGVLRPTLNAALVTIPIVIETTFVLLFRTDPEEVVFSAIGALILIGSTIAPGALRELLSRRYRPAPAAR
ncbi:MAG TPA: hypothetical protein VNA04_09005 [Thermoanaerobaculia bacterium]|nr:hypothetical protein [Thermoanaerobaculia bacterium]